jgi:hypothetical protein
MRQQEAPMLDFFRRLRGPRLPRIIAAMPAKRLWTTEDLARHWHVTQQAVFDRIARGKLEPHYIIRMGARTMHLFDPDRLPQK